MALNASDWESKSLLASVDEALADMAPYLTKADLGVIQAIRSTAKFIDEAEAKEQLGSAVYAVSHVYAGLEKLGGSVASRKTLGIDATEDKQNPLSVIRGGRNGGKRAS